VSMPSNWRTFVITGLNASNGGGVLGIRLVVFLLIYLIKTDSYMPFPEALRFVKRPYRKNRVAEVTP